MPETPQRRAIEAYRNRLTERGLARFEVVGRDTDRDLIRTVARCLAEEGAQAEQLRAAVARTLAGPTPKTGGILAALRRSPLVGQNLHLTRAGAEERAVDL